MGIVMVNFIVQLSGGSHREHVIWLNFILDVSTRVLWGMRVTSESVDSE